MKKGVGFGVGSGAGSISQSHNVTDPQHWMQGTKDHFFLDMADDVVRGSIVLNKGVKTWPPNPPIAVAAAAPSKAGLEKTRFSFLKTQPSGFFLGFFLLFFWLFSGFFGFFLIYLPRRESFLGFFQFQEYF
jgi:hypothetical protein